MKKATMSILAVLLCCGFFAWAQEQNTAPATILAPAPGGQDNAVTPAIPPLPGAAGDDVAASPFSIQEEQVGTILYKTNDGVFACEQDPATGIITVKYVWPNPAVVYQATLQAGKTYRPGRTMGILKIKDTFSRDFQGNTLQPRSKPELKLGITATVKRLGEKFSMGQVLHPGDVIAELEPNVISHDSVTPSQSEDVSFQKMLTGLWQSTGLNDFIQMTKLDWTLGVGRIIMIFIGLVLLYLAIFRG
ncbi:MAG: hypothetical protein IKS83_00405, partial [Victivallales bacterium]|nr:hypothetical protein [Victivallales bacterium]